MQRYDPATYEPPYENPHVERARGAAEWVGIILAAVVVALLVKSYAVQAYYIPSGSMEPTLMVHDRVVVNKLSYDVGSIQRGDVVVFNRPPGETEPGINVLIKRVIALPGDSIEAQGGIVYINGVVDPEKYLPTNTFTDSLPKQTVPAGDLWVMGDNRENSSDSRVFGAISKKLVIGHAILRVWPVNKLGTF